MRVLFRGRTIDVVEEGATASRSDELFHSVCVPKAIATREEESLACTIGTTALATDLKRCELVEAIM